MSPVLWRLEASLWMIMQANNLEDSVLTIITFLCSSKSKSKKVE